MRLTPRRGQFLVHWLIQSITYSVDECPVIDETTDRKTDVPDARLRLPEFVAKPQLYLVASGEELVVIFATEFGQHAVVWHQADFPYSGRSVCAVANIGHMAVNRLCVSSLRESLFQTRR